MPKVTLMLTEEKYGLLTELFEDAIYYRRSDDDDEDGKRDNKQADQYVDIMESIEVEY